jgi:hypothetical protein
MPAPREDSLSLVTSLVTNLGVAMPCRSTCVTIDGSGPHWARLPWYVDAAFSYPTVACADFEIAHRLCGLGLCHQNEVAGGHGHLVGDDRG